MSAISKFRSSKITNQNTGGGNKLSGLPPSIGGNAFIREAWKQRAIVPYDKRNVVFCINQLGGIGNKSSMFNSNADGVDKKNCAAPINLFHWNIHWETFSDTSPNCGYALIQQQFKDNTNNADFISLIMGENIDWTKEISKWTNTNYHSIYISSKTSTSFVINSDLDSPVDCSDSSYEYAVSAKILYNADKWKVVNTKGVWTDTDDNSCEVNEDKRDRPVIAGRFRSTDNQEVIICSGNLPHIATQQACGDWWINDLLKNKGSSIKYTSKDKYIFMMDTNYASDDPSDDPIHNALNSWVKASSISNQLNTLTPNIAINDKTGGNYEYGFNENARTCCYNNLLDTDKNGKLYDSLLYPYDNIWANSTSMSNVKICSLETITQLGKTINECIDNTSEIHKWVAASVKL